MNKIISFVVAFAVACCVPSAFADCRVVEYTMDDCPACVSALSDVGKLLENGVLIEVYNTDANKDAEARAIALGALKRPTFIVFDGEREIARFEGAGQADAILDAIKDAQEKQAQEQEPPEMIAPVINPDIMGASALELPPQTDFRTRPRVVDRFENVGFLDKSRDAWNGRDGGSDRRNDERNRQQEAPKVDRQNDEQDTRLGDRFSGKIIDGASGKLDEIKRAALEKLDQIGVETRDALKQKVGEEFEKTRAEVNAEVGEIEKAVVSAIRLKIDEKIDAFKTGLFYCLFFGGALFVFCLWNKKKGAK